jgi:hypothetical protein
VFFVMPGSKQACPNSAACWSPAMPLTGTPAPTAVPSAVTPKRPLDGRTSGRHDAGTSNRSSSSGAHERARMSNSMVRLAFDASVACSRPPVSCHSSQLSTVPKARSGDRSTPPSRSSHSSFDAEK